MTKWFAWYPVQLWNGERAWFRRVYRELRTELHDSQGRPYFPVSRGMEKLYTYYCYHSIEEIENPQPEWPPLRIIMNGGKS